MMKKMPQVFTGLALAIAGVQAVAQPAIPGSPGTPIPGVLPGITPATAAPATPANPATPATGAGAPAAAQPQVPRGPMQFGQAMELLTRSGFMARPYYNGVPDPVAQRNATMTGRNRKYIAQKLRNIVIPKLDSINGFTLTEVAELLNSMIKLNDPERDQDGNGIGVNIIINQFMTPGAPSNQATGGTQGGGATGGQGGTGVDPSTGLPLGTGGGMPGGGTPQVDPTTGLPVGGGGLQGGGAPGTGAPGGGLPGVGGGAGAVGGGLPGVGGGGGLPGIGGGAGLGGGAAGGGGIQAAFDPDVVKVRGLNSVLQNLTAKQVLDIITMSFDYPIQYVIMDQGVVFVQKPASQQGYFTRTFRLNPSAVLGFPGMSTAGQGGGGTGGGGTTGGGGAPGGGGPGGGGPGGGSPGGGMGGPGGGMGGPGGGMGGPGGGMGGPGGSPGGSPGGGRGGPAGTAFHQFNVQGIQTGNRYNMQPFTGQNFQMNGGFQRFNSFTPGYGRSRAQPRQ